MHMWEATACRLEHDLVCMQVEACKHMLSCAFMPSGKWYHWHCHRCSSGLPAGVLHFAYDKYQTHFALPGLVNGTRENPNPGTKVVFMRNSCSLAVKKNASWFWNKKIKWTLEGRWYKQFVSDNNWLACLSDCFIYLRWLIRFQLRCLHSQRCSFI